MVIFNSYVSLPVGIWDGWKNPHYWLAVWWFQRFFKSRVGLMMFDGFPGLLLLVIIIWLVVWNRNFIFPDIGNNHPNWLSYFSDWLKPPTWLNYALVTGWLLVSANGCFPWFFLWNCSLHPVLQEAVSCAHGAFPVLVTSEFQEYAVYIWVNYNDLTATSLGMMVNKGNHPQMALIQVSEIL